MTSPYQVMFEIPPPREIISLVNFPPGERGEYEIKSITNNKIKDVYNQTEMKMYCEE